jgi:hypothetical protein
VYQPASWSGLWAPCHPYIYCSIPRAEWGKRESTPHLRYQGTVPWKPQQYNHHKPFSITDSER